MLLMLLVAFFSHFPGLVMTLRCGGRGVGRNLGEKAGRGKCEANEEKAEKFFHGYKMTDVFCLKISIYFRSICSISPRVHDAPEEKTRATRTMLDREEEGMIDSHLDGLGARPGLHAKGV